MAVTTPWWRSSAARLRVPKTMVKAAHVGSQMARIQATMNQKKNIENAPMTPATSSSSSGVAIGTVERRGLRATVAEPGRLDQSLLGMNFISSLTAFEMRRDEVILRD